MPGVEIFSASGPLSERCTLSNADLFWISEVKWGRTDLINRASPGREPDEGLAALIAPKIDAERHLSGRRLAQSLGIAAPTVWRYLTEVFGMKCRHLRCMPHTLAAVHKVVRVELAQRMLRALAKHKSSHFISCFQVTSHECFTLTIIAQCGSHLGRMSVKLSDFHISSRR
jgi:predicted transcriptional regulator